MALMMEGLDLDEATPAPWRSARLRTQLLTVTAGLWVFCFFSFFAATFLWNNWAPPLWLMAFNAGACLSGALLSLALAQVLIVQRRARAAQRWASGFLAVMVFALAQTFVDQQIWRELARIFMAPAPVRRRPRPAPESVSPTFATGWRASMATARGWTPSRSATATWPPCGCR